MAQPLVLLPARRQALVARLQVLVVQRQAQAAPPVLLAQQAVRLALVVQVHLVAAKQIYLAWFTASTTTPTNKRATK